MSCYPKSSTRVLRSAVSSAVPASTPILSVPAMSRQEFLDLEREAGHPFISDEQAYLYRMAKIFRQSVERLLTERSAA